MSLYDNMQPGLSGLLYQYQKDIALIKASGRDCTNNNELLHKIGVLQRYAMQLFVFTSEFLQAMLSTWKQLFLTCAIKNSGIVRPLGLQHTSFHVDNMKELFQDIHTDSIMMSYRYPRE